VSQDLNKSGRPTSSESPPTVQVVSLAAAAMADAKPRPKTATKPPHASAQPSTSAAAQSPASPAAPPSPSAAAQAPRGTAAPARPAAAPADAPGQIAQNAAAAASPLDIPAAEGASAGQESQFGQPWEIPTPVRLDHGTINAMVVTCHKPRSQASEQFRQLRTTLIRLADRGPVRCMITSAQPREGKTVMSANLAYSFSELAQKRTLLIDCDLRRGRLADLLGLPNEVGLGELLSGRCTADDACRPVGRPSLHVITAGRADLDAIGQLFGSTAAQTAMRELIGQYDYVLLDTPPVLGLADTGMLGSWVDVALLAVRINKTPRALIDKAAHVLTSAGVNVAGLIAVDAQAHDAKNYYAGYAYYG
jgi:capsular exopolysaccharide synthesis family protein